MPHTLEGLLEGTWRTIKTLQLPIDSLLPELVGHIERNTITLLEAEPGAGKTTRVPPTLLRAGYQSVYVLEPRRLAARLAAGRVAAELNEPLGKTAGYQVRFEKVGTAETRIWFLTEGVFTNRLLANASLPQRSLVILDEFHERHLETDLALALLRTLVQKRPDLRILIMSATLGTELPARLPDAPVMRVSGRQYPVEVRYTAATSMALEEQVAAAVARACAETAGHVLVFLPGAAEIRKAVTACRNLLRNADIRILPLHGDLNSGEQDEAVAPSTFRKVICSTNVAESSVTIQGVTAVVDSGLARMAAHSPWSGYSRLQLGRISRASALQRAGRAGRTAPGIAIRLYSQEDFARRPEATMPEILRADWAETYLRLSAAGYDPATLPWLDSPVPSSLTAARDLLMRLNAFHGEHKITDFGRQLAKIPVHPRLACLVSRGAALGVAKESCRVAAWLAEERILDRRGGSGLSSDLDAIFAADQTFSARRVEAQLRECTREIRAVSTDKHALERAILCGYPDHIAAKRGENLMLANGSSARLDRESFAGASAYVVALAVEDRSENTLPLVRIAIAVEPDWLLDLFPGRIETVEELRWNRQAERIEQVNSLRYERLVLDESFSPPSDLSAASDLLVRKASEAGLQNFTEMAGPERLLARIRFAQAHGLETESSDELTKRALAQLTEGLTSFAELRSAAKNNGFAAALEGQIDMRLLDEIAPAFVRLPSGRRAPIEYVDDQPPAVCSRLQDFFGMQQSPAVARGLVPLTVKLLAPNGRPVQITTDLVSFWRDLYPQVRRELGRRYPRHSWPETPVAQRTP